MPSSDRTLIVWKLTREDGTYGYPLRALRGHSHFVSDVAISQDGVFALLLVLVVFAAPDLERGLEDPVCARHAPPAIV